MNLTDYWTRHSQQETGWSMRLHPVAQPKTCHPGFCLRSAYAMLALLATTLLASAPVFAKEQFFGLSFGMSRQAVQKKVGKLAPSLDSKFQNAFDVKRLPNEKLGVPKPWFISQRTVYFDEQGKLWRIWVRVILQKDTLFGSSNVFHFFIPMNMKLAKNAISFEGNAQPPNFKAEATACPDSEAWQEQNPESFALAQIIAPQLSREARVVFDIGCGAIKSWSAEYREKNPLYLHYLSIQDGNLYATPVVYAVTKVDSPGQPLNEKLDMHLKPEFKAKNRPVSEVDTSSC